jgi:CDP-diacylglycerol--glycerol-3-phosphate 3-phosphatidyltransferase
VTDDRPESDGGDPAVIAPSETHPISPVSEPEASPWNVPNALTVVRILLVPVFAVLLLRHPDEAGWRLLSTGVFIAAILTDSLDGYLARRHNIITRFGKLADPIADKALTGMAFIGLSIINELPWWITIVMLVREWGITIMRFVVLRYGVMAAGRGGKVKTAIQAVALLLYLLPLPWWTHPFALVVMLIALVITVVTGLDYIREAVKLRRKARGTR